MPLPVQDKSFTRDLIPAGLHPGRCVGVIDIGTQQGFQGKPTQEAILIWELPEQRYTFERDGQHHEATRVVSQKYSLTMDPRSNLRKMLESWRNKKYTAETLKGFDLAKTLNAVCQIQVLHNTTATGTWANVASVMPWPRNTPIPLRHRPLCYFSFADVDRANPRIPEDIPAWIVEKIKKCPEWQRLTMPAQCSAAQDDEPPRDEPTKDDLPF
jgi:hypothetical protein